MPTKAKAKNTEPKAAAAHPVIKHSSAECPPYKQLSDDYMLDHMIHANVARFTGGISPISMALAGLDWWAHLMFSPAKKQMLSQSFFEKTAKVHSATHRRASGKMLLR